MQSEKIDGVGPEWFVSAKCPFAIPHAGGLLRDLLIQLTLDPMVVSIGHVRSAESDRRAIPVDTITIRRTNGRVILDLGAIGPADRPRSRMR